MYVIISVSVSIHLYVFAAAYLSLCIYFSLYQATYIVYWYLYQNIVFFNKLFRFIIIAYRSLHLIWIFTKTYFTDRVSSIDIENIANINSLLGSLHLVSIRISICIDIENI